MTRPRARPETRWTMLAAAALLTALPATAATILGHVARSGRAAADLPVTLSCPGAPLASGRTDARGAYQLSINADGKCELRVDGAAASVILFGHAPTQYDFELQGSGTQATLRPR